MKRKSTFSISLYPQNPGSNDNAFRRCTTAMRISRREFEFGIWFLYFRSRDFREELNEHLGYTRNLKYQMDVSIMAKKTLRGVPHGTQFV